MFNEWYLTRSSNNSNIFGYPSMLTGISKHNGCVEYRATCNLSASGDSWGLMLSEKACKKIFGCFPKQEELLCVTKTRKGWKSEKIELEFTS